MADKEAQEQQGREMGVRIVIPSFIAQHYGIADRIVSANLRRGAKHGALDAKGSVVEAPNRLVVRAENCMAPELLRRLDWGAFARSILQEGFVFELSDAEVCYSSEEPPIEHQAVASPGPAQVARSTMQQRGNLTPEEWARMNKPTRIERARGG